MSEPGPAMGCEEAVARLWSLLDGDLDEVDRAALDQHLGWCLRCCGELAFARHLRAMLRERSSAAMPSDVHARLDRFIDAICAPTPGGELRP